MPLATTYTDNDRFHNFKKDYPIRAIRSALNRGDLSEDDVSLLRAFLAERCVVSQISSKRMLKVVSNIITIRRFLGVDLRSADITTVYSAINSIKVGMSTKGTPFSQNTQSDLIKLLKLFLLWMSESGNTNLPEKKIKAIKPPRQYATKTDADLITPDEITGLIEACLSDRDRAMFTMLYEGGFRSGEIGEMRWKNLTFDGTGVIATVKFKTENTRHVRLVMSKEHLIKWRSVYPGDATGESFVFLTERGKPLTHAGMTRQLGRLEQRAGIDRHLTLHLFRHSRITHLLQQGVHESVIKMMMWGAIDTLMFKNYAHLNGDDTDREIFRLYGLEHSTTQVTGKKIEPHVCPHCKELNGPMSSFCHICGHSLTDDSFQTADEIQSWLMDHSELLVEFLQSRQNPKMERS